MAPDLRVGKLRAGEIAFNFCPATDVSDFEKLNRAKARGSLESPATTIQKVL
jgi:hypothetical protein